VASGHYLEQYCVLSSFLLINAFQNFFFGKNSAYALRVYFFQDKENTKDPERKGNKQLLLENIDYALDMFLIYLLTLSIFPGFLSEDTGSHSLGTWYVHYQKASFVL